MRIIGFIKGHFSVLKSGILPGAIIFMALYLLYGVLTSLFTIGLKVFHFSNILLSYAVIAAVLLAYVYVVAILLKSLYLRLLKNKYPEVMFQLSPESGVWLKGFITGEYYEEAIKKNLYKVIYAAHFNPFCFTVVIETEKAYLTGKNAMENIMFNFSGGICEENKNKPLE